MQTREGGIKHVRDHDLKAIDIFMQAVPPQEAPGAQAAIDAATLAVFGNHEFDKGQEILEERTDYQEPAADLYLDPAASAAGAPSPVPALPCGSISTSRTRRCVAASDAARLTQVVVLPTPPFWFATAIIRVICSGPAQQHCVP